MITGQSYRRVNGNFMKQINTNGKNPNSLLLLRALSNSICYFKQFHLYLSSFHLSAICCYDIPCSRSLPLSLSLYLYAFSLLNKHKNIMISHNMHGTGIK